MKQAGDPKRLADTAVAWNRVQASLQVEVEVLAGIEHVETGDPESDCRGEEQDVRVERAANGDPGGSRGDTKGESQNEVRPARPALGVRVEQQDGQRYWREQEREMIQLPCCQYKNR